MEGQPAPKVVGKGIKLPSANLSQELQWHKSYHPDLVKKNVRECNYRKWPVQAKLMPDKRNDCSRAIKNQTLSGVIVREIIPSIPKLVDTMTAIEPPTVNWYQQLR